LVFAKVFSRILLKRYGERKSDFLRVTVNERKGRVSNNKQTKNEISFNFIEG